MRAALIILSMIALVAIDLRAASWSHSDLYEAHYHGEITNEQLDREWRIARATCKTEGLRIPIPSPSCTTAPQIDCTNLSGFTRGTCEANSRNARRQDCDYTATWAADRAQREVFENCLVARGWELKAWVPPVNTDPDVKTGGADRLDIAMARVEREENFLELNTDRLDRLVPKWRDLRQSLEFVLFLDTDDGKQRVKYDSAIENKNIWSAIEVFDDFSASKARTASE